MPIHNIEIAKMFNQMADLLEIQSANPFRVRAYRNAAFAVNSLSRNLNDMVRDQEDLTDIPGIGSSIAQKIKVIVKTGELPQLKSLQRKLPAVLCELMRIEGLGPKRVKIIYQELHIHNLKDLKHVIEAGKLRKLRGFGKKIEERILAGMLHVDQYEKRWRLSEVMPEAEFLTVYLKKFYGIQNVEICGSYRRHKETVADLDILVTAKKAASAIPYFLKFPEISEVLAKGPTKATVRLHSGIRVDLRAVPQKSYGSALQYFTGSKSHSISLRKIAVRKKLKLNEYGVFRGKKTIAGKSEEEVYHCLGLSYIEPELREDHGEIAAAKAGKLPKLIKLTDLRGDLHAHTKATDGRYTIEAMALAAAKRGYEYLAITDHSQHLAMTKGFNEKMLRKQFKEIDRLNSKLKNILILKSIECDILENGTLDLADDVLHECDLVVCSLHSKFNLNAKKQTERVLRAMDNPYFTIFAHPTGRLINRREPYEIDLERIMKKAKERNIFLEVNAQPSRLDLADVYCKMAKNLGVKLAISTDAHSINELDFMKYGIFQARRGWLEAKDVINTRNLEEFKKLIKRK